MKTILVLYWLGNLKSSLVIGEILTIVNLKTSFVLTNSWKDVDEEDIDPLMKLWDFFDTSPKYAIFIKLKPNYPNPIYTQSFSITLEGNVKQFQYVDRNRKTLYININRRDKIARYLYG